MFSEVLGWSIFVINPVSFFSLQGEFCSQGVRESLVVSFIKFVCQSSRQFCESTGDKGGSTPPALLLLLSRLCLDYETSTISYILTLTDEQFLVQVEQTSRKKISTRHTKSLSMQLMKVNLHPPILVPAPQPSHTCHNFMCRSKRGSTETTEPLCKGGVSSATYKPPDIRLQKDLFFNLFMCF